VPVEFFFSLIKQGRVTLLLDGYDEMAQYMHLLERRACLEALADLGRQGARGILTSRPNYFSEAEELNVLESLYTTLGASSTVDDDVLTAELALDELLQRQFVDRRERRLQDLDADQTRTLVQRRLGEQADKTRVVLELLAKVSRPSDTGPRLLSGKPVIISYLVELADTLALDDAKVADLSEYACFKLIIDKLMQRDKLRAPMLATEERRSFLQALALQASSATNSYINEQEFVKLIDKQFSRRIGRLPSSEREAERQRLFSDLRSSATLTRFRSGGEEGWRFSHNSLREFLVVEHLLGALRASRSPNVDLRITETMWQFTASLSSDARQQLHESLAQQWPGETVGDLSSTFALLWQVVSPREGQTTEQELDRLVGPHGKFDSCHLQAVDFSRAAPGARDKLSRSFSESTLIECSFRGLDLRGSNFTGAWLESVDFTDCDLRGVSFARAGVDDVDFSGANLEKTDFATAESGLALRLGEERLSGERAVGALYALGASTREVAAIYRVMAHTSYPVAHKIARKILEGGPSQVLGLTQRGVANKSQAEATRFVALLIALGYVREDRAGSERTVERTADGRRVLRGFVEGTDLPAELASFFTGKR
jgi:hypothetical protein